MILKEIENKIFSKGFSCLLVDCFYDVHGKNRQEIPFYYNFLFRLIQITLSTKVIEIGTFKGGSSKAMACALKVFNPKGTMYTVDIEDQVCFKDEFINYVIGDSLLKKTKEKIKLKECDILYIDSVHTYKSTMNNFNFYISFNPKYIIFDDIHLNEEMNKVWVYFQNRYDSIDVSEKIHRKCGFGVMAL